jgi:hypothetical protein
MSGTLDMRLADVSLVTALMGLLCVVVYWGLLWVSLILSNMALLFSVRPVLRPLGLLIAQDLCLRSSGRAEP